MNDQDIIWIPTGLAARILGVCNSTMIIKYKGSIRHYSLESEKIQHYRWSLEDCKKIADEERGKKR